MSVLEKECPRCCKKGCPNAGTDWRFLDSEPGKKGLVAVPTTVKAFANIDFVVRSSAFGKVKRFDAFECLGPAVDWRARALLAETRLASLGFCEHGNSVPDSDCGCGV